MLIFGSSNDLNHDWSTPSTPLPLPTKCPVNNQRQTMGKYVWAFTSAFSLNAFWNSFCKIHFVNKNIFVSHEKTIRYICTYYEPKISDLSRDIKGKVSLTSQQGTKLYNICGDRVLNLSCKEKALPLTFIAGSTFLLLVILSAFKYVSNYNRYRWIIPKSCSI